VIGRSAEKVVTMTRFYQTSTVSATGDVPLADTCGFGWIPSGENCFRLVADVNFDAGVEGCATFGVPLSPRVLRMFHGWSTS
jgi:hypothetical protein